MESESRQHVEEERRVGRIGEIGLPHNGLEELGNGPLVPSTPHRRQERVRDVPAAPSTGLASVLLLGEEALLPHRNWTTTEIFRIVSTSASTGFPTVLGGNNGRKILPRASRRARDICRFVPRETECSVLVGERSTVPVQV